MRVCVLSDCFELHIYLFEWPIVTLGVMHVIQTGHMCPWLHDCTYSGVSGVGYHFVNRIFFYCISCHFERKTSVKAFQRFLHVLL